MPATITIAPPELAAQPPLVQPHHRDPPPTCAKLHALARRNSFDASIMEEQSDDDLRIVAVNESPEAREGQELATINTQETDVGKESEATREMNGGDDDVPKLGMTFQTPEEAVAKVFPKAHHRQCLWHIMKRIPKNLQGCVDYKEIKKTLKKVTYDNLRTDEFEEDRRKMVKKYKLENNEWLKSLYEDRHYWAPVFVKETFWAGMSVIRQWRGLLI